MSRFIGTIGQRIELVLKCTGEGGGAPYYNKRGKPLPPKDFFWFEDEEKRSCLWFTETAKLKRSMFLLRGRTYRVRATIKHQTEVDYSQPVTVLERVSIVEEIKEGE